MASIFDQFPIDVFQTGSGTSTNMNLNEVIATLSNQILEEEKGQVQRVGPNDHVNMAQSSNDVIPSAIQLSALIAIEDELIPAMEHLSQVLEAKMALLAHVVKTGRTHLMDAMPVTMGQELSGWKMQIDKARQPYRASLARVKAVGAGRNSSWYWSQCTSRVCSIIYSVSKFNNGKTHSTKRQLFL